MTTQSEQADQFYADNEPRILALDAAVSRACNANRKDKQERRKALLEIAEKFDSAFVASCIEFRAIAPHRELAEALAPEPVEVKPAPEPSQEDDYTVSQVYDEPHIRRVMLEMNHKWAMVTLGADVRIMREPKEPGKPPTFHGIEGFRNLYLNKKINVPTYAEGGGFKPAAVAKLWLDWPERRTYEDGVIFEPEEKNPEAYNLWRGYPTKPIPGDWSLLRGHVLENICGGDEEKFNWFMTWCAQIVRQPGRKMGSAVAIKGLKGTGKTKFFEWFKKGMGNHAIKVSQKKHIVGDFNGHHRGVTLMVCEEAFWAGDHAAGNALKDLITSEDMLFEQKGIDAIPLSNYIRLAFISNHEWLVPVGAEDERRYFVLECSDARRGDIDFFIAVDDQMENGGLEAMWHELSNWDAHKLYGKKGWNVLRQPPVTEAQLQQREAGLEVWDRFFIRVLEDGGLPARSNPDLPEITLEENEVSKIPVSDLRAHYDYEMKQAGTADARRRIGNSASLLADSQKWLDVGENAPSRRVKGEKVRVYLVPPLAQVRAKAVARGVRLDVGAEIEEPQPQAPTRGDATRFAVAACEAPGKRR